MQSVLVILEESAGLDSVLACALLVARRFGSLIEGLRVEPTMSGVVAAAADGGLAAAPALEEAFLEEQREATRRLVARFEDAMRAAKVPLGEGGKPWARSKIIQTGGSDVFGSHARLFDLAVLGRPTKGAALPSAATLEAVLFEGGRPILIAPPALPKSLGERVVVAWNGSTETARSVAFALPFLKQAQEVVVLTVVGGRMHGPAGAEAVPALLRHGVKARAVEAAIGSRDVGQAILDEAVTLGADLVVKGAYTTGRLRQLVFGGATSHIMTAAELPVLMAY